MRWLLLLWPLLTCGLQIAIKINDFKSMQFNYTALNGVYNASGSSGSMQLNASIAPNVCAPGFYWHNQSCWPCLCENRTIYENSWVEFTVLY